MRQEPTSYPSYCTQFATEEIINTLYELSEASCTMAHDHFSLGVVCTPGDTVFVPNPVIQFGTKTSFDACASDTNQITIAQAAVFLASSSPTNTKSEGDGNNPKPVEFSIGCTKGTEPLSNEEWNTVMNAALEVKLKCSFCFV